MNFEQIKKNVMANKTSSILFGVSMVLTLIAIIAYAAMKSDYFSVWALLLMILGILLTAGGALFKITLCNVGAYLAECVGFFLFLKYEVEVRMDTLVDTGLAGIDAAFYIVVIAMLASVIIAIVGTCKVKEDRLLATAN
jgi:hypothetical protein